MTEYAKPIHPGEMLKEEFLEPLNMSAHALSVKTGLPASRISEIIRGRRGITADTALRLAQEFGNSAEFWMNLQVHYDLSIARQAADGVVWSETTPHSAAFVMERPLTELKSLTAKALNSATPRINSSNKSSPSKKRSGTKRT